MSPEKSHLNALGKVNGYFLVKTYYGRTWVAQSVKLPTSAQVTISQFVGSSPASGSVLTAQSLETASDSVSPSLSLSLSLSALPLLMFSLSLKNKH